MGHYNKWAVLIIPAAIKAAAIRYLEKNGITGDCFEGQPIILDADDDEHAPRGYAAILKCDNHMVSVLRAGAALNPNAHVFVAMNKTTAKQKALHFIRTKGYRIGPKYWIALIVRKNIKDATLAFLDTHDIVPTQTRALIRKADSAGTPARAFVAMISADKYMARVIRRKVAVTSGAFVFISTNKANSQAEALAFIDSKGFKIR